MDKKVTLLIIMILIAFKSFAQESTASPQISTFTLTAPQLQTDKKIWLYLPKNYSSSSKKYPVLYMPDAQNLFDKKTSYSGEWNVDEKLDSLNAQVIVVGIEHGNEKRIEELTPFPHEKYGGGKANQYLEFLTQTLKPYIDKNFRTLSDKKNTLIIGSSLGGLTAYYATLKYPEVFGKAGVFSPAFWINKKDLLLYAEQNSKLNAKYYFLCGDKEGDDDSMVNDMNVFFEWSQTHSPKAKKNLKKIIVKDGHHNEKLWRDNFVPAFLWLTQ